MMEVTYKGYRAVLAPNNHVIISRKGKVVSHGQVFDPVTEDVFCEMMENTIDLMEKEDSDDSAGEN